MKKSELKEFIKSEIIGENRREEAIQDLKFLLQDLASKSDEAYQIVKDIDPREADRLQRYDAFSFGFSSNPNDETLQAFYQELTGEDGETLEAKFEVPADELSKVKPQIGPDDEVKITEDDEEATPDKGVAKRGNKLDRAIKDLRAVEKNIKTHLAMFKDAEGVKAKEAAMNMLKKDNDIKKELTSLIKRLEGDVIK